MKFAVFKYIGNERMREFKVFFGGLEIVVWIKLYFAVLIYFLGNFEGFELQFNFNIFCHIKIGK